MNTENLGVRDLMVKQHNGKVALITGATGQDGAYLSELLLEKGYNIHGLKRRSSSFNTGRIEHLYQDPHEENQRFVLHYGDMTDSTNLIRIVQQTEPDEIYNLPAQSHVQASFETAEYTANADAVGALRLLEAIRILGLEQKARFYQASTSELYGKVQEVPQGETTPFYPRSPYAAAKIYAYWIVVNYCEAYGMHASNGILFNHESPLRGETFVTRKITRAVAAIHLGFQDRRYLGNLDAKRDWGHAKEYVRGMWLMLQQDEPDDYVLATGKTTAVHQFVEWAFSEIGITLDWKGSGADEKGYDSASGRCLVEVDKRYFRPTEVELLLGDPTKAHTKLGWKHETSAQTLCAEMGAKTSRSLLARSAAMPTEVIYPLEGKRVRVAGHNGLVGSAIVRRLARENCEALTVDRKTVDLKDQAATRAWILDPRPDAIFLAAARAGGILANDTYPVDFLYGNLMIEANVIEAAHRAKVSKLLFLGSSCIYPKLAPQPIPEESLLTGPLEPTNEWYAIAKIAGIKLCQAYRKQYGCDYISVMPTNFYGPGDNFDLNTSHIIPALIRKAHEAKLRGDKEIVIWGTGTPRREFLQVDDCADACEHLMSGYSDDGHINVGSGDDLTILELTKLICEIVGFTGEITHGLSKSEGTPRKLMSAGKISTLGWSPKIALSDGLSSTYRWYCDNRAS